MSARIAYVCETKEQRAVSATFTARDGQKKSKRMSRGLLTASTSTDTTEAPIVPGNFISRVIIL
jgi:hypothetical protein